MGGERRPCFASRVAQGWGTSGPSALPFRPILEIRTASLVELVRGRSVDVAALQARATGAMRVDRVSGLNLTLTQRMSSQDITAPNVVGILEGSDPALKNEYVIFSGHMDHVGIGTPDTNGDSIFNGADDDASGTIAVVEIAEAMAALSTPPRRSTVFLLVSGEEKGLWGSEYYSDNPTVPVEGMVADFNTDMVGRNWPDTIVAIGKEHSDLGQTLERVNAAHPELRNRDRRHLARGELLHALRPLQLRADAPRAPAKCTEILQAANSVAADVRRRTDYTCGENQPPPHVVGYKSNLVARVALAFAPSLGGTRSIVGCHCCFNVLTHRLAVR